MGKNFTFREIRFKLETAGFIEVWQLGNHAKFVKRNSNEIRCVILPHYVDIAAGTLSSIIRQAGFTEEEFLAL